MSEYQSQFEKLCNRVYGLSPDAILNCFLSGLYPEIRKDLAILKPSSITQAIGLAKLIEAKIKDTRPRPNRPFSYQNPNQPSNPNPAVLPSTNSNPSTLPVKRLTAAQMQERRAQGLCYNCDAKFVPGHHCTTSRFLLLLVEEEEANSNDPVPIDEVPEEAPDAHYFQLSPEAISGSISPKALKFTGLVNGLRVTILVDTGSTHNIMQPRIAHHLQLFQTPIKSFTVMVGNGEHMTCTTSCPNVPLWIQAHYFEIPCYLLPIEGADIVLGLAWLATLGHVIADFSTPSLSFVHHNHHIQLTGQPPSTLQHTTFTQLQHLIHTDAIATLHLLSIQPITPIPQTDPSLLHFDQANLTSLPMDIQALLSEFTTLFQKPSGLPPPRFHDHHINLLPNTQPVKAKPYRYPHSQKETISQLINEMLQDGIIKPSTSPFSSPVLLVKKKRWYLAVLRGLQILKCNYYQRQVSYPNC